MPCMQAAIAAMRLIGNMTIGALPATIKLVRTLNISEGTVEPIVRHAYNLHKHWGRSESYAVGWAMGFSFQVWSLARDLTIPAAPCWVGARRGTNFCGMFRLYYMGKRLGFTAGRPGLAVAASDAK